MRHVASEVRANYYSGGYRPSALDEMKYYARLARKTGDKAAREAIVCGWLELARAKEVKHE